MDRRIIYILVSLLFAVLSFQDLVSRYDLTIDPQIHWVFNSLFNSNFEFNREIIFPHGPLSFLEYPLGVGNNILISSLFSFLVRFLFALSALLYIKLEKNWCGGIFLFAIYLFLMYLDFELLLCGLVFLFVANHLKTKKILFLTSAVMFSAFSFYIKISIGVISGSILGSYLVYLCTQIFHYPTVNKASKENQSTEIYSLLTLISYPLVLCLLWTLFFGSVGGFLEYLMGVKELIIGNSDSASLYPDNNWIFLSVSIFSLLVFPFTKISKQNKVLFFISLLSMLSVWKHSMAREDAWHIMKYFYWIFFILSSLLINEKKWKALPLLVFFLATGFYYLNSYAVTGHSLLNLKTPKLSAIQNNLLSNKSFLTSSERIKKEASPCTLDAKDKNEIGEQFVDCYPYNYCFIQENDLNWQPRPISQSYAAYTPWLDQKNANHFASKNAPAYIIWEMDMLNRDRWNSAMTSIDGRYLLHDEPKTFNSILQHYSIVSKSKDYVLWKKRKIGLTLKQATLDNKTQVYKWGEWIPLPESTFTLKIKARFQKSILAKLKAALYKGDVVFIEYKTNEGIKKYRFTNKHAQQGILVSPLLENLNTLVSPPRLEAIRFTTYNENAFSKNIAIDWLYESLVDQDRRILLDSILQKNLYLSPKPLEEILYTYKHMETTQLIADQFSPAISVPVDSLISNDSTIQVQLISSLQFKMPCLGKTKLVIEVQNGSNKKSWSSIDLDAFITHCNTWESMYNIKTPILEQGDIIKLYVWNSGKSQTTIKEFSARILTQ